MENTGRNCRPFTANEIEQIFFLRKAGFTHKDISEMMNRSNGSIGSFFCLEARDHRYSKQLEAEKNKTVRIEQVKVWPANDSQQHKSNEQPQPAPKATEMTPREMIKKLYDMGYRIENNKLVCIVKQVVNLQDIING